MGRKPKVEPFKCLHCARSFQFAVKWCPSCEDHFNTGDWAAGKDVCDRCHKGLNDEYLKRKKAFRGTIDLPVLTAEDRLFIQGYLDWVESPAYADRFKLRFITRSSTHVDFCRLCGGDGDGRFGHAKAYHINGVCHAWTGGDKPCKCKGFEPGLPPAEEKKK